LLNLTDCFWSNLAKNNYFYNFLPKLNALMYLLTGLIWLQISCSFFVVLWTVNWRQNIYKLLKKKGNASPSWYKIHNRISTKGLRIFSYHFWDGASSSFFFKLQNEDFFFHSKLPSEFVVFFFTLQNALGFFFIQSLSRYI